MPDFESIKRKYSHALRGLNEVKTDKDGRELINTAVKLFKHIAKTQEKMLSQLEIDNAVLMLKLTDQTRIQVEHTAMKLALFNTVKLDEIEDKLND